MATATSVDKAFDIIKDMTILELRDLNKKIEEELHDVGEDAGSDGRNDVGEDAGSDGRNDVGESDATGGQDDVGTTDSTGTVEGEDSGEEDLNSTGEPVSKDAD